MSRSREVAEFFLANQGRDAQIGTLMKLQSTAFFGNRAAYVAAEPTHAPMFFGDVSWISKFPDEEETLVGAGARITIESIEVLAENPLLEFVVGHVWCGYRVEV